MKSFLQTLLLACLVLGAGAARAGSIVVFAAASLTDSLQEIAGAYTRQSGEKVALNFAASSFLARQIQEGAPADIFFSADQAQMDSLEKRGLIVTETRRNRLSNSLVIVVADDSRLALASARDLTRADIKRIALADPQTVPAGIYSKKYLDKLGLWPALAPKIVPADNVRAALAAVESGNVEVGMVYKTDAAISKKVRIAFAVPPAETPGIVYPVAMIKDSKDPAAARKFLDYLNSTAAARVFGKFGFLIPKNRRSMTAEEWQIVWFTAWVSALSTLLILPFGLAAAWLLARRDWPGKSLVQTIVTLPLVMPPVATGLILLQLLGRRGPLGRFFHDTLDLDIVFTWRGVLIALGVMSFPLLVLSARIAFEQVPPRFEQIARTLGAGEARVFFTITLPLAWRGVLGGMTLAFARALGEFGATIMVAGNIPGQTSTLSLAIFQHVQLGQDAHAWRLLAVSVALAFLAVWASQRLFLRPRR